jgi:hypothetical protein
MKFIPGLWKGAIRNTVKLPPGTYLLAASSWAQYMRQDGSIPPANLPLTCSAIIDPGGYYAAYKGAYSYDFLQYLRWLFTFPPGQVKIAGMMDYCCLFCRQRSRDPTVPPTWAEVLAAGDPVREQQEKSSFMAYEIWWYHREVPWMWMPTLQGLTIDEYVWHAREMRNLILQMKWYYGPDSDFRVAIGSLGRAFKQGELPEIVQACSDVLPGVRFHLYGPKRKALQTMQYALPDCVESWDSSMWHGQRDVVDLPSSKSQSGETKRAMKAWQASGKTQLAYAVENLPIFEQSVYHVLAKPRPTLLPFLYDSGLAAPQEDITTRETYEMFKQMLQATDLPPEEIPYPEGYAKHFERPNANDWFLPWVWGRPGR